jgi:hypothetical protein
VSPALRRAVVPAVGVALLFPAAGARADDVAPPPDPVVTITAPAPGAVLGAGVPATLAAEESDGISVLAFQVGDIPVCALQHLRYCTWTPEAKDIGDHMLLAGVTDAFGRTASAAVPVRVERLAPPNVGTKVKRKRLGRHSWRLRTKGTVALPAGLTAAACGGRATVTVLSGKQTLVDRTVPVSKACGFASDISLRAPNRVHRLTLRVAFEGAPLLAPRGAGDQTVRLT